MNYIKSLCPKVGDFRWWLGFSLTAIIAYFSNQLAAVSFFKQYGLSILTIAIILGIIIGNSIFKYIVPLTSTGIDYSKNILLRLGIILYGFRITFQENFAVGWQSILIDVLVVVCVFTLGFFLGHKIFKMDKKTSALIGAGSAICGAAAVMATEPVVRGQSHKVSIAVATVVIFGTISMFLYPAAFHFLNMTEGQYGIYVGSTVHEVAQVVAAGNAIGETAAANGIIVKMFRVMLLVPFLIILSLTFKFKTKQGKKSFAKSFPWFALMFIVASGMNSLNLLPKEIISHIEIASSFLLAMAMVALGLRTHIGAVKQAGLKPLLLAFILFVFLIYFGYALNKLLIS